MSEPRSLSALLDELSPFVPDEVAAWGDVVARAGEAPRPARRRRSTLALALAVAAACVVGAAALATGGVHRFTAWLRGTPGTSAPAGDQAGFLHRNATAFARFPAGTTVRLLGRTSAGGKRFNLLGFRDGDSLCLRVVRADLPAARGSTQCASLSELEHSAAPAVVVADAWFRFGRPAMSADGVYGFADDTVRTIEVVRERTGAHSVAVSANAFLALGARPGGTVADHPAPDPITGIYAVQADGTRVRLAYISAGGAGTREPPPKPPFYLAPSRTSPADIPGPSKIARPFGGGTIGWVFARQPRGAAFVLPKRYRRSFGDVVFGRTVQPDPSRPDRVALMLVRLRPHAFGPKTPTTPVLCFSALQPLDRFGGSSCMGVADAGKPPFRTGQPIVVSYMWPTQISHVVGLAADAVASIRVYLANGRVIPVAVRDNTFVADVPQTVAAKVVAYDSKGRVIGIAPLGGGELHYAACPRYTGPTRPIGAARPYERIDLGTGELDGHAIVGATEAEVVAALGRPDRVLRNTVENGVRIPDYLYGGTRQGPGTTQIQFGKHGDRIVAVSMMFQTDRLADARLGRVLAVDPSTLQRRIERTYPSYHLTTGYGTLDAHGCQFTFNRGRFARHLMLTVFLEPQRPAEITLVLRNGY